MMLKTSVLQNLVTQRTIYSFSQFCGLATPFHSLFCLRLFMWLFGWQINGARKSNMAWLSCPAVCAACRPRGPLPSTWPFVPQTVECFIPYWVRLAFHQGKGRSCEGSWTPGSRIPIASLLSHSISWLIQGQPVLRERGNTLHLQMGVVTKHCGHVSAVCHKIFVPLFT